MPNEEDRKWLYGQFKDNGYDTGSYDDFVKSLDNDEDFEWWHKEATSLGLEVGDLKEFGSLFRTPKEEPVLAPEDVALSDEPDLRPLNEEARLRAEENARKEAEEEARRERRANVAEGRSMFDRMREKKAGGPTSSISEAPQAAKDAMARSKAQKAEDVQRFGTGKETYSADDAAYVGRLYEDVSAESEALNKDIEQYNKTGKGNFTELNERQRNLRQRTDELRNSPAWKEYLDLSDRYNTLSAATETPEIRLEKARLAAELSRNPIARVGMGAEAPSESQIDFDTNRAEADFIESQMETADRAQKKEYKARLKELNREVLDNDYYQADVAKRIAENDAEREDVYNRMTEIREKVMKEKSKLETLDDALMAEPEYQKLLLASSQLEQTGRKLAHIRDKNAGDFWVNFMDVFSDPNTYNFGITNLETALATKAAQVQTENDYMSPSSDGAVDLLSAVAGGNAVSAEEGKYVEGKGKYGQIAAQSIPFMLQIGLTGGFGNVANAVSKRVTKALGDKFLVKATGAALGDLAAGFVSANTIGGAKTMTDILNNYYGTLVSDGEGGFKYEGGQGLGRSVWGAEVGNTLEYASERAGDHMQHLLGRGILGWGIKSAQKNGRGAVNLAVEELAKTMDVTLKDFGFRSANQAGANWAQKAMGGMFKALNQMGVQGLPFEVAEEYVGLLGNIILGGEEKWMDFSKLGDKETHTDIWGGMLYSIGLTQAGAVAMGGVGAGVNGIRKAQAYHQLENALEVNSNIASTLLGEDEWRGIKETIDGTTNKELPKKVVEYMNNKEYDPQQRAAILDYVKNTYLFRGFNAGTIAQARERLVSEDNLKSLNINAEAASAQDQISDAYMLGYQQSTAKRADVEQADLDRNSRRSAMDAIEQREEIEQAVARQKSHLLELTLAPDVDENYASTLLDDENADPELRDAALGYLMAVAVERGFDDAENNRQLRGKALIEGRLKQQYGKFYYEDPFGGSTVETSQTPNPATKKWENIFLLSGEPNENGEVPFVSLQTGRRGYVKREQIAEYDGAGNIVPGLTKTQSLNDFLDEQYAYEQAQREAGLAQQDAAQTAQRQVAENQQAQQGFRDAVEGMEDEDGAFTYNGKRGRLIRKTDIGAVFEPEDGSDNVELTWEQLAQSAQPAAEHEPSPAPAPEPAPAEEPEEEPAEEAPKIPVDKNGNPVYDAPGVSVEDALADMYSTEGLDEADVDEYILNRAAEAEKGRAVKQGKMSLKEWGAAKKEANRIADFWGELAKFANENKAAREKEQKEEAARQELIKKYGVDTSKFDLTPQTAEEAVAEYLGRSEKLINLEDAIRETLGKRKDNRVPTELFRHLGAHGILTKNGGRSIADVARDIVGEYEGTISISEDDVRDAIIDMLTNKTKSEIRETIFNNRLQQARDEAEMFKNEGSGEKGPQTPPAEVPKPQNPPQNPPAAPEKPEGGEKGPAAPEAPKPAGEKPEGQKPEGQEEKGGEKGGENPGNAGNTGGNSVPLGEGKPKGAGKPEGPAAPAAPAVPGSPAEIKDVAGARAFFEAKYGKGSKADTAVRVWELGHKTKQAPASGSDNGPVSKMAALSASSGNPLSDEEVKELKLSAIEFAVDFVNDGAVKFPDFFKTIVETFGDNLRHYAKFLYNGTKMEVSDDVRKQMDSDDKVYNFDENIDLNDIGNGEDNDAELRDTGGSAGTETPGEGTQGNGGEAPGAGAEPGNPGEDNPSEPVGGNGEGTEGGDNGVEPGGEGNGEGGEVVAGETGEGTDEPNRGGQSGGRKSGGNGTGRGRNGGRRGKRKESGESSAGEEKGEGETAAGEEGTDVPVSGGENTEQKPGVTPEVQYAKEEQAAFEAESERIKDEEDTDKLKDLKSKLQEKIDAIKDRLDLVRAKLSGQLRAVLARLKDVFSASAKKAAQLAQEKIPYKSVADETGAHDIGNTVVPSGAGDAMRNAIKRVEQAVGKPIAEFVREELGYKSLDDMFTSISAGKFTGLASEQVDALGLAIYQMKTGKMFIVGDMTGVGKGRTAAGLIRWGLLHGKKVLFATQTPDLFSSMYEDLEDIGSKGLVPWIVNEDSKANIQKVDENDVSHVIVKHPGEEAAEALYSSGKDELPVVRRDTKNNGKRYQFVMTTYSQLYAGAEEKEGDSERVKKLNQRQEWGRKKAQWLKLYAKDAIVIMDESHNASGNSSRGNVFRDMVADAAGVTFLSATYAKRPQNMAIYALRSSMGDAMVSQAQMLQAIVDYGVPMQEMLAAALFETGEMVRRERDATGMYTHWVRPEEVYPEEELKRSRQMFDRTVEMVNKIIAFQRTYVNPIIEKMNKDVQGKNAGNMAMMLSGVTDDAYIEKYASTQYSSQVSRLTRAVMLAIKAKKAAEMAVQQIKDGNKPVIAIDETLETELKQLKKELGEDENADMSPDFGRILQKAIDFSLRYQHSTDHYKKVWNEKKEAYVPKKLPADRKVEKFSTIESYFGEEAFAALDKLREEVSAYGKEMLDMDLTLSPIDQMRKHITDAGYRVEEITGRKSRFVKKEDGKWAIEPMKVDKPRFRNRFNGGKAKNPVPEEERLDCLIINRSGATGTNLHASKAFGDQKPRKMIIVEPAQNVDEEVQVRGRIDRTGQVHRGEYFYLVSPIPIESRFLMNLRRKLASLDASAVGTDKVSTNRVDVEDMENKYGDEIAKDFLSEHEEINDQMDNPITQDKKTKKWIGREGLMSDLLKAIQRMTCAEQEVTLQEIGEMYADKMEYLSQNGINDMTSTTMDLEAVTIDKAVIVKGKNNKSVSVFAHDTTIERVEVNNLTKPILSADIERQLKAVGAMTEDGKIDLDYGDRISAKAEEAKKAILAEKKRRYDEALADYEANIRENTPQPEDMSDEDYEMEIRSKVDAKRNSLNNAYANDQRRLETQRQYVGYAARYLKPGRPYLVPLNESKDADTRYGRFLGFEAGKDGRASSVKAVFAVRDSRGKVSFPVAAMHDIIENLVNSAGLFGEVLGKRDSEYASKEEQMADWNQWWDRMTPKSNRTHRFMITGNILQAIGSLSGHRGSIVTFTRRDPETGEISIERGLLLAEDFDPDTFMVRTRVTKEDVWDAAGELADDLTRITVYRDGNNMVVKYRRDNKDEKLSSSPLLKDKDLNELCETPFAPRGVEELQAVVPEKNVQKVLDMLYDNYNFTIGTLLVMPDSTDKPDRIVYTNKPHVAVINEIGPQFPRVHDADDADREVKNLMAQYRRDVTNEKIKERIQLLVQLRQAYIRGQYAGLDDGDLAWQAIIAMSQYNKYAKPVPGEKPEQAKARKEQMREYYNLAEAYKEELLSRGAKKGTAFHFKQGKIELSEIEKTFKKLNSDKDVAKVAEKVFAIARKIPRFEIFLNERIDTEVGGYTAGEAMSFNWNFMNEEIIPDQMKASTIVHELVHTATVYVYRLAIELNNDVILQAGLGDVMIELQSIYNAIRQNNVFRHQFGKYTWNTYTDYGIKNTKEMLSEAGANPKFRDLLKKVTLAVTARSGMITFSDVTGKEYTGKTQTAFDAIMERLDIILDSFDANAFNEAWTGTGYGGRSQYFRRAENLRNPIDRAAAIVKMGEIAKKLGVKFKEDPNLKAKGVFSPKTGEIRINIDAHKDTADLEATLLHEAVAHYGLRKLFGDDWKSVRKTFYEQATDGIKAKVDALAKQHGLSKEVAMEEYIASLAEDGRFDEEEETFWQRVVTAIKRMLHKIGFNAGRLTDDDFRALLYASFVNMRDGGPIESAAKIATYQSLRKMANASHEEGPDDEGPGGGRPTSRYERESESAKEMREIRDRSIADGSYMKAPNGQPTNLTEDQWLTVRTKAFKDWFGDWEKDPANASKVVDENGEPKVVYHGTPEEFDVFDSKKSKNKRDFTYHGINYFTENKTTADTYGHSMPVFLNIRNPYEYDFEGRSWRNDDWSGIIVMYRRSSEILGKGFKSVEEAEEFKNNFLKEHPEYQDEEGYGVEVITNAYTGTRGDTTDEIANSARKSGHDGTIFNNVIDYAEFNEEQRDELKTPHSSYTVFSSNQVKSATGNNGNFNNEDENIYHRFIGERGARRLDIESPISKRMEKVKIPSSSAIGRFFGLKKTKNIEVAVGRLDNLETARKMEAAGKDPLKIKIATGWEKGADGDWRFEEPDVRLDADFIKSVQSRDAFKTNRERELQRLFDENTKAETDLEDYINELADKYQSKVNKGMLTREERKRWEELEKRERETREAMDNAEGMSEYIEKDAEGQLDKELRERRKNQTFPLTEVLVHDASYERLMVEYPDLAEIKVSFYNDSFFDFFGATRGYYNPKTKKLMLNPSGVLFGNDPTAEELTSVMLHELQHVIQHLEGFASGGNTSIVDKYGKVSEIKARIEDAKKRKDEIIAADAEWKARHDEYERLSKEFSDEYKAHKAERARVLKKYNEEVERSDRSFDEAWDKYNRKARELRVRLINGEISRTEYMRLDGELEREREASILERPPYPASVPFSGKMYKYSPEEQVAAMKRVNEREQELKDESEELRGVLEELNKANSDLEDERYRLYRAISGEVEARNVQTRMSLSDDERYNSLAESTEDVDRAEQIILSDALESFSIDEGAWKAGTNSLPEDIRKDVEDLETEQETEVLYRRASNSATAQTAAEMYGDKVRTIRSAVREVLVDEMRPVDTLLDALATESGSKIKDDERVSDMMRETGGKAMRAVREYDKKFLQPMWSAVGEFRKKTGTSIKDTETYIGLKSGLERNIVLAQRDAKRDYQAEYDAEIDEINQEEKTKKRALDKQLKDGKISDITYAGVLAALQQEIQQKRNDAETRRQGQFADVDAGTDKRFLAYRKKDYSAITAWAETEDLQEAERLAGDYVADMESRAGGATTKELWKRINAATKETLKFQYEHQILSRQQYQDISKMMKYYVPMRGFAEDTAEDLFNYYVTPQSNDFQATVLAAKGRKTWYEGPLGNIGAMHSSAISQGVKNDAKLALLDAVRRRPNNTIATVTRAWFVKNGQKDANGKDQYDVAYPQIPEGATLAERESIIEQFEEDMAEAKRNGDAYNSHREVDLHGGVVAFERQAHKNEHIVQVREGGKEYGILINGNPAAAQAINGVRRSNGAGEKFLGYMRSFTRVLSSMFTTFSVPFWVSNFQRDHGQGLTNAFIRNNPGYVGRYIANRIRAAKLFPLILGSETMDKALAKGDPVANLYKQYLDNGGPMGQNRIEDNEYFERQMKRYLSNSAKQGVIKGATAVLNIIGGVGEAIETITRFAVFMTSMESGRPIHESISDAKEISTNFARKGSGRSFSRDELDRMTHADGTKLKPIERGFVSALSVGVEICRATIPFFNAAVQGLENKVTNYREHWGKTLLADSVYLMLGFGMKMLLGGAGGDDDKEKYSHTSDYLRRNNILNPLGNGVYAKWALPQEYRVMYALGDILASAFQQERPAEDLGMDVFGAIMQLSPIGAVTDEVAFSAENKKKAYETLITNASPGIVAPVLESIFNMDFKGARIYNEGFNENLHAYPGWTKALPTTGSEYVAMAKWLNNATGGNDVERGWVNINPAIVEHLVESYFSGPYQIVVRLPEAAVKIAKGEATVRDVPLLNRIILNTNDNQRDAYYNNMYYYFKEKNTEAERIHSEYKDRPKEGKVAEFYNSDNYKYMLIFNKYDKIERELRKASKQMAEKGDKEKQKEYDERLQNVQYQIANECLNLYFKRNEKEEVK